MRLYFHHYHYARVVCTQTTAYDLYAVPRRSPVAMCIPSCYLTCYLVNLCVLSCCTIRNHSIFSFATARFIYTLYVVVCDCQHTYTSHHQRELCRQATISYHNKQLKRNNRPAHHVNVWSSTYCITHLIFLSPKDFSTMLFNVK